MYYPLVSVLKKNITCSTETDGKFLQKFYVPGWSAHRRKRLLALSLIVTDDNSSFFYQSRHDTRSKSAPFGIRGIFTLESIPPKLTVWIKCSTPYGIRGMFSKSTRKISTSSFYVLNALRHQRNLQAHFRRVTGRRATET